MKANFEMNIDGDNVKVIATRPGNQKPVTVYSAKGQGALNIAQNVLLGEIHNVKKAFLESARKTASKAALKATEKKAKKPAPKKK